MSKVVFEKRWEARHPVYRPEAVLRAYADFPKVAANECKNMLLSAKNSVVTAYFDANEMKNAPEIGFRFIMKDLKKQTYIKNGFTAGLLLVKIAHEANSLNLKKSSNSILAKLYSKYFENLSDLFGYYNLSRPDYTSKIDGFINKKIFTKEKGEKEKTKIKDILLTPLDNSDLKKLDKEILILADAMTRDHLTLSSGYVKNKIKYLLNRYEWISTQENNPPLDEEYFFGKLQDLVKKDAGSLLKQAEKATSELVQKKNYIINKYKFDQEFVHLMDYVSRLSQLRLQLRLNWTEAGFYILSLFKELNQRLGLGNKKNGNFYYSEYLTEAEIINGLRKKSKVNPNLVKERIERYLLLMVNKKIELYAGKECDEVENRYISQKNFEAITSVSGTIANKGHVKSKAWIIDPSSNQLEKAKLMKKGYILIAAMTRPQFTDAIVKSSAIITDEGGLTCHAAIISREFNKPCIVGTKISTKIFKDNDLIEVDANKGIVKKLT